MNTLERDHSPIDQQWIQRYCDQLLEVAHKLPAGAMRDALLRRVECSMDLLDAWQTRKHPR